MALVIKKKPKVLPPTRSSVRHLVQSQLTDTKYPQVWYDLEFQQTLQEFDSPRDAQRAAMAMRTTSKKTLWRVIAVVDTLNTVE